LAPCGNQITPDPAAVRRVPRRFPTLAGWTATGAVTQGTTVALRGAIRGEPRDIVDVRDTAVHRLVTQGYVKTGGDEEPGFEADADFSGPHQGNINVRAACQHYLVVTYTLRE
jgi:hypothetical protein